MGKHVPGIGMNQVYEQNTVPQLRPHPRSDAGTGDRGGIGASVQCSVSGVMQSLRAIGCGRIPNTKYRTLNTSPKGDDDGLSSPPVGEGVIEVELVRWLVGRATRSRAGRG